ncbi:MAG: hypothetical protein IKU59_02620 [Bacteroidales bacterium]|nr:hypothetical protein [Bacteroidales bacterium]
MRYFFLISFFVLIPFLGINAQENSQANNRAERMAKYMSEKKAHLKECIPLSDSEAEKFFALYDEMEKKKFSVIAPVYKEVRDIRKSTEEISDERYSATADKLAELAVKVAAIENEYYEKFKQLLSPKQMFMFFNCENSFGKSMLKKNEKK